MINKLTNILHSYYDKKKGEDFHMPLISSVEQYEKYMGISPKPADFDEYWGRALLELDSTGMDYELIEKKTSYEHCKIYDLYFTGTGNGRIHCLLTCPKQTDAPMPGVVFFHGYTSNIGSVQAYLPYAYNGMAALAMDVRGQGGLSSDGISYIGPSIYGQIVRGVEEESPDRLFFRNIYLDAVKAVRILMSLDFVDENRIGTSGKSQGGALTIVSAALETKIKLIAPIYPFLSDFKQVFKINYCHDAYSEFSKYFRKADPLHQHEEEFFQRLGYIDIQNFADKVKAPALWFMALMDNLCHPTTQFAAYNKLQGPKELRLYPEYGHEPLLYSEDLIFEYFKKGL